MVEIDVVRHFDFRQIVLGDVAFKRLADGFGVVHGLPHADEVRGGGVKRNVTAGREDEAVRAHLVHQFDGGLLVVLLRAEQHGDGELEVAGNGDAVGVRELFGFHDVDVFVDGDAVGPGEAHGFDVLGGVAADEEGGGHTLFAHGGEELRVGGAQEGFEHVRGDLRDKRVHGGNDVAPGLDVVVRNLTDDFLTVGDEGLHAVLIVVHIHKDVGPAQVRGEGERAADEAVHGDVGLDGLEAAHDVEDERDAPVGLLDAPRGDDELAFERVRADGGRGVVVPCEIAAEDFSFDLQVEHGSHAVRGVLGLRLDAAFVQLVRVAEHFLRGIPLEVGDLGTGVGNPGGPLDGVPLQCLVDQRLAVHDALLGCVMYQLV